MTRPALQRDDRLWVPPGYDAPQNAGRRHPALYLNDGQNCLDHDPFGHGGWQAHAVADALAEQGLMAPVLLVMVENTDRRADEYVPGRAPAGPGADGYLDFLERDVLPFVDAHFRTVAAASHRALGGSSFGALISLYGAWTRPQAWSRVLAMSPAFAFDFPALVTQKRPLRVYLDSGTEGPRGDDGRAATERLRDRMLAAGWIAGRDLLHRVGEGHGHTEDRWRERLPWALPFLLPPDE
jgi:enterochelin esterase-like enzyme